jgi:hypothetical protein
VFRSHAGDHCVKITLELLGAFECCQAVREPEQESTEKGDYGERLLPDES